MTHSLSAELVRLNQEIAELRKENDLLWRAYELAMGNPYQHLTDAVPHPRIRGMMDEEGYCRKSMEEAEVRTALQPGHERRLAEGVSVWSEYEAWLAEQERRLRTIPSALRREVMKRDGRCTVCGATSELQIDHIIPLSRGGRTRASNLQVLCRLHNSLKRDLMPDEWAAKLADLRRSDPSLHCCAA